MTMRALLISTVSSIALATTAFAADLPNTKGPAPFLPPPPPVFSWTGIYVGANAGGSLGTFTTSDTFGLFGTGDQYNASSRGFSGGGQIGINYQFADNIVVGVEADFQGSTLRGSYDSANINGQAGWNDSSKVNWWGTGRARLGYAFGNILPYVTGGVAYGKVSTQGSCWTGSGPFSCDQSSGSVSGTHVGWTAGAGLEYAITHNLTLKFEYLYTDLGSFNSPDHFLDASYGGPIYSPGDDMRTRTTFSTVRAGVNWKFDWLAPAGPVVAKY